jgi:hypothetical protein
MIQKLRGTIAIAVVIVLIATGPVVTQVWFQAANAQLTPAQQQAVTAYTRSLPAEKLIVGNSCLVSTSP